MKVFREALAAAIVMTFAVWGHAATDYFVWRDNPTPVSPYTSWDIAATSIQDAVDLAVAGDTVYVTNGVYDTGGRIHSTYPVTNRVYATKAINIISMNGPAATIIKGVADPDDVTGCGPAAVRCASLSSATLIGFTLTNGYTLKSDKGVYYDNAGGVFLRDNAVVSNCVVAGNTCWKTGGGTYTLNSGKIYASLIIGNEAFGSAGGVSSFDTSSDSSGALWSFCTLTNNTAPGGGGGWLNGGMIDHCMIAGNAATVSGGGGIVLKGKLFNSVVSGNTCGSSGGSGGGGIYMLSDSARDVIASNCIIRGNAVVSSGGTGGGAYLLPDSGTVIDCVISNNSATYGGGSACG